MLLKTRSTDGKISTVGGQGRTKIIIVAIRDWRKYLFCLHPLIGFFSIDVYGTSVEFNRCIVRSADKKVIFPTKNYISMNVACRIFHLCVKCLCFPGLICLFKKSLQGCGCCAQG